MSDEKDDFLKDLQAQCLVDSQEYLDGFMEDLSNITQKPLECFKKLAMHIHSLKGNVQAAGFLDFGRFLHDLESELTVIESGIKSGAVKVSESEYPVLEFLLSDAHHQMSTYSQELKATDYFDKPEHYESRKNAFLSLRTWWESVSSPAAVASKSTEHENKQEPIPEKTKEAEIEEYPIEIPVESKLALVNKESFEDDNGPKHYLLCKAGNRYYGVLVSQIVEIVSRISFVPLPVKRNDIKGLVNLRGETVSILSLDSVLGTINDPKYLVICENSGRSFGFEVEEAERVLFIQNSEFHELPESGHQTGKKKTISHVVHYENKQVMILNMNEVLAA